MRNIAAEKKSKKITEANLHKINMIVDFCLTLLRYRDVTTHKHTQNVFRVAGKVLDKEGVTGILKKSILIGCCLHDIGKIFVPSSILLKAEKLNACERQSMNSHPLSGHDLVSRCSTFFPEPNIVEEIVLSHHERNGGNGYPHKIKELPFHVEVVAVVDISVALQEQRVYRNGMGLEKSMEEVFRFKWSSDIKHLLNKHENSFHLTEI